MNQGQIGNSANTERASFESAEKSMSGERKGFLETAPQRQRVPLSVPVHPVILCLVTDRETEAHTVSVE